MTSVHNTESDIMDMFTSSPVLKMKASVTRVLIAVCAIGLSCALLSSCAKINLSGKQAGGTPPAGGQGSLLGGGPQGGAATLPTLDGTWEVDYEFKGTTAIGNVEFAQQGNKVAGSGADQSGLEFNLDGTLNGDKVSLVKTYVNAEPPRPPVTYTGQLKYLDSPEYQGWAMEGEYSMTTANGQAVTGKWVANPTGPASAPAGEVAGPGPGGPAGGPPPGTPSSPLQSTPSRNTAAIGDAHPNDISGRYAVGYQYKFKKNNSKMWLKQDGDKLSGDGQDTTTGDKFSIRGWYKFPKVTIIRSYKKGAGAKENREMTFQAKLSSDGRSIVMAGETEFGGQWDAHLVR